MEEPNNIEDVLSGKTGGSEMQNDAHESRHNFHVSRLFGKEQIDTSKMSHIQKQIFEQTGLNIENEAEAEAYMEMTRQNKLAELKQLEALLVLSDVTDFKILTQYNVLMDLYNQQYAGEHLYSSPQIAPGDKDSAMEYLHLNKENMAEKMEAVGEDTFSV